jgi:anti-sigma regulatory factor (Ser/Thr protein kinase)
VVITAADAGSVTVAVRGGVLVLDGFSAASGWTATNESVTNNVDISFRREGDDRVDVDVEVENGRVRVRVRDRRTDSETETDLDGRPFG